MFQAKQIKQSNIDFYKKRKCKLISNPYKNYQLKQTYIIPYQIIHNFIIFRFKQMIKYEKILCIHHHLEFQYFCQSCEQPVCSKCTLLGPHNNQIHLINHISESFKLKIVQISDMISNSFSQKRHMLLSQINRLEYRLQQIKTLKQSLKKQNLAFSSYHLQNLHKQTEEKIILLKRDIQILSSSLSQINDFGHFFQTIIQQGKQNKEIHLLANYNKLEKQFKQCVDRIYEPHINIHPEDLPKVLSQLRYQLKKVKTYQTMNQAKYLALEKILQRRQLAIKEAKQLDQQYFQEQLKIWQLKTQQNMNMIRKYLLVCHFCGKQISEQQINNECSQNLITKDILSKDFKGFCLQAPEHIYLATARHYFAEPRQIPNLTQDKTQVFEIYLEALLQKLKLLIKNGKIQIKKIFEEHDGQNSGCMKYLQLLYILREICKMPQQQTNLIIKSLPKSGNLVKYEQIIQKLI